MLTKLDLAILDYIFEPLAVWLNRHLGVGTFQLARIFLRVGLVAIMLLLLQFPASDLVIQMLLIVLVLFNVIRITWDMSLTKSLERRINNPVTDELPPNLREHFPNNKYGWAIASRLLYLRGCIFWLTMTMYAAATGVTTLTMYVWIGVSYAVIGSGYYFLACAPRPPMKKNWSVALVPSRLQPAFN